MKIIDFFYYYLVMWFKKRGKVIDPIARPAYALGICSILWMITIDGVIEFSLYHTTDLKMPKFVFFIVGLAIIYLLQYIYVKRKRYYLILERNNPKFNVSDKSGMIISIIFIFLSLGVLLITSKILHSIK